MVRIHPIDTLSFEAPLIDLLNANPHDLWYFALGELSCCCIILEAKSKDQVFAFPHVEVVIEDGCRNRGRERLSNICIYSPHVSFCGYLLDLLSAVASELQAR